MKKLFFGLFFLSFIIGSQAQLPYVNFIPRVGFNLSNVRVESANDVEIGKGWCAGLGVEIGKRLYFEPGLHYAAYSSIQEIDLLEETLEFHSIQTQFLLGYNIIDNKLAKIKFHAGPVCDIVHRVLDNEFSINRTDFETGHWGFDVGVGAKLLFFTVFLDWQFELSPVLLQSNYKHGVFSLTCGLSIL